VRHVRLYYYLEDDSIEIVEKQVRDSGMPQGCQLLHFSLFVSDTSKKTVRLLSRFKLL